MYDISIIIVNYNTSVHLKKCLKSIEEKLTGESIEIIVVDNDSTDREIEKFPSLFPRINFIFRKLNDGFSGGCNFGVEKSTGKYLLFLNPDIILKDNSLTKLKHHLEINIEAGIVSGVMCMEDESLLYFYNDFPSLAWEFYHLIGTGYDEKIKRLINIKEIKEGKIFEVDWFHGAFLMMRRVDFGEIGGFNENYFMYYEDVEICYMFKKILKKKNYCLPEVKFHHHTQSSLKDEKNDDKFIFHLQRGKLIFIENYSFIKRTPIYLTGLLYVISRIIYLPLWSKYRFNKSKKLNQLSKVLKLYLNKNYLYKSKFEYIRK